MPERRKAKRVARQKKEKNTRENEEGDRRDSNLVRCEDVVGRCALCHSGTSLPLFRTPRARSASLLGLFLSPVSINPYTYKLEACNNGGKLEETP